jgi:proline utilization trans-activator
VLSTSSYLSDLQAKLARLERNPGEASTSAEIGQITRRGQDHDDDRRLPGVREEQEHRASPTDTRESSPRSRQNAEDADLTNPMVESSKFMSSSSGRACEYLSHF